MALTSQQREVIRRCQKSAIWFMRNFIKIKHPGAGIVSFNPFDYQQHAIRCFRKHRMNIFRKTRQCFRGDQMVWTPSGPKRIDSVVIGDPVYTLNTDTGLLEVAQVQAVYQNGAGECVVVQSKSGHSSVTTADHRYFTTRGEVAAGELTTNDVLLEVCEPQRYSADDPPDSDIILLAYLITDGHYGKTVHFTNTCWHYLLEYQKHYELKFGDRLPIKQHGRGQNGRGRMAYRITSNRKVICDWLKSLGIYGDIRENKKLPDCVFRWSNRAVALLLNRMFAADGWYASSSGNTNEAGIGQLSLVLLHQIKQLLSRFAISAAIYQPTARNIAKLRIIGGPDFERFHKQIGILGKEPRHSISRGFIFNRHKGQIKRVVPLPGEHKLYDLKVGPYDNYVVDGAVVHNCGISKVSGVFALWFAMFSPHKTILIVSRKDDDAMSFLSENVKLPFENLPAWMRELWKPVKDNEHEFVLPNGSKIKSLTSHPDVLRSNASSLNIIDEAGFIQDMDAMWAAGRPVITHGGSVIVISTTNGVGNWYWNTWTDAEAGANDFNPLMVNWWDMKWSIEYRDVLSGDMMRIAPTEGIVPTAKGTYAIHPRHGRIELRPEVYGPFWSPWLESQYRDLQEKGEAWKFDQEVLAAFVGSGNTVLPKSVLIHVGGTVNDNYEIVTGPQTYVHPVTGDQEEIDFTPNEPNEGLWIWRKPVLATPDRIMGGRVIQHGRKAHAYVMGVDIATGKGRDWHGLEIFDVDEREQAAEGMFHCLPATFKKIIDRVGRWYNCALTNVERNNGGDMIIDDLNTEFSYPRLWRKSEFNGKTVSVGQFGFFTSSASKPALNKFLLDYIRDVDEHGFRIYSRRLWKQLQIYVRKRDKAGRDTGKTEAESGVGNYDDLVMATGLAIIAVPDSYGTDAIGSVPFTSKELSSVPTDHARLEARQKELVEKGGVLMPLTYGGSGPELSAQDELMRFAMQLGGLPTLVALRERLAAVHKKKYQL